MLRREMNVTYQNGMVSRALEYCIQNLSIPLTSLLLPGISTLLLETLASFVPYCSRSVVRVFFTKTDSWLDHYPLPGNGIYILHTVWLCYFLYMDGALWGIQKSKLMCGISSSTGLFEARESCGVDMSFVWWGRKTNEACRALVRALVPKGSLWDPSMI